MCIQQDKVISVFWYLHPQLSHTSLSVQQITFSETRNSYDLKALTSSYMTSSGSHPTFNIYGHITGPEHGVNGTKVALITGSQWEREETVRISPTRQLRTNVGLHTG
jgi:hypothetical protein